jgi:hypothetical protein
VVRTLELGRRHAEAFGVRRRSPLSPSLDLILKKEVHNDLREIGPERAPPLEFPEDRIVVQKESHPHDLNEFRYLVRIEMAPLPGHTTGNAFDARQGLEVGLLPIHRLRTGKLLMRLDCTDLGAYAV